MTKAFGYLRVSGKDQIDGDGFKRQKAAILEYAAKHDIEIVEFFEEKGVSGKTEWESRPAWSDMIGRLNGVRSIVIERLDRLARDLYIQEYILRDLAKREVTLLSAEGEDLEDIDPTRIMFRQILGAIAQYDRTMIVRKLKSSRERMKAATGRCEGVKPYGTQDGEERTLDTMRLLRSRGNTYDAIAAHLNTLEVPTRYGKSWYGTTVANILRRIEK